MRKVILEQQLRDSGQQYLCEIWSPSLDVNGNPISAPDEVITLLSKWHIASWRTRCS